LNRILIPLAAMVGLFMMGVPVALATTIEISIDTVVTATQGSVTVLETADTPPDLIGMS
jgi:mannose/fructose/N-acetylgalactosamine-specific phosphotransferase system component IID